MDHHRENSLPPSLRDGITPRLLGLLCRLSDEQGNPPFVQVTTKRLVDGIGELMRRRPTPGVINSRLAKLEDHGLILAIEKIPSKGTVYQINFIGTLSLGEGRHD